MSQDIVADALNQIMNSKKVEKRELVIKKYSKVLLNLFEIMKERKYIEYFVNEEARSVTVKILKLNECKAVKPRYYVGHADIEKYLRRFIPSRRFGNLVISTNKGLMTQREAEENKIGGSLIAYFY